MYKKEYDYVLEPLEDMFVRADLPDIGNQDPDAHVETESERKARSIDEVRKSLPVFAYREAFLQV